MTKLSILTPQEVRVARSLLGWPQERLAARSGTTTAFVWTYEKEGRVMRMVSRERSLDGLAAIRAALEAAGVEFTNGDPSGVQLRRLETP
ncbi:MAG: transcriptional regulator [Oxalobacteraceae bacterium]|nr:MAG: transcriptional regulator [Oxalobacteraceae bacterium]